MKPIHEITYKEWEDLPLDVKAQYPRKLCNPNWRGYYINLLLAHIQDGGKITKKIWESLPIGYQNFLIRPANNPNRNPDTQT